MENREATLPGRRRFLRLAAASGAMAGISAVSLSARGQDVAPLRALPAAEDLIARGDSARART